MDLRIELPGFEDQGQQIQVIFVPFLKNSLRINSRFANDMLVVVGPWLPLQFQRVCYYKKQIGND